MLSGRKLGKNAANLQGLSSNFIKCSPVVQIPKLLANGKLGLSSNFIKCSLVYNVFGLKENEYVSVPTSLNAHWYKGHHYLRGMFECLSSNFIKCSLVVHKPVVTISKDPSQFQL